jgi:phospholipid transport system substrate-binding protein
MAQSPVRVNEFGALTFSLYPELTVRTATWFLSHAEDRRGSQKMRKLEVAIAALSGFGLLFAVIADADQRRDRYYGEVPEIGADLPVQTEGDADAAGALWEETSLDEQVRISLMSLQPGDTAALARRLDSIATAAGDDAAPDPEAAAAAVRRLASEAMAVMTDAGLDDQARVTRFRQLLHRDFDMPLIARFALGRHWRNASEDERRAYVEAFSQFVLQSYASRLAGARLTAFDINSAQPAGKRDVMVATTVKTAGGTMFQLVWRMRSRDGAYRVIDVVAEGISLAVTKRQEFAAILSSTGGRVASLIDKLEGRTT